MSRRKTKKANIIIPILIVLTLLAGGYAFYHFNTELEIYRKCTTESQAFFSIHIPQPFINSAADAEPYKPYNPHDDALYFFDAPEGFTIISHSQAWNRDMLESLYYELLMNEHGDEINALYEVIVYPYDEEEGMAAATYTPGTKAVTLFMRFPAFPEDFSIDFPQDIGSITLYSGDTNTTVESMAGSLSHEYGHHYTFYYMFGFGQNRPDIDGYEPDDDSLAHTIYAVLRDATRYNLITSISPGENYFDNWYRYLVEVAAEDYVQLMGSPTTRQVVDFVDVQQLIRGSEHPEFFRARNAFPQANMMIPLANDVPGLKDYFYNFIGIIPRAPIEEKQTVTLQMQRNPIEYLLTTGPRTFVHFEITWNAPYQNAIYTLVCYDPNDYNGWGIPIKTVRPGQNTSAIIGDYAVERGNQIVSMNDGNAEGSKIFYVVALLPDGTFYISDKLEHNF